MPRLTRSLFHALTSLALVSPASALNWQTVAKGESLRVEIDTDSMARIGEVATAWERMTHASDQLGPGGGFYFRTKKTLLRFFCDRRQVEIGAEVFLDINESEIKRLSADAFTRPALIVPGSDMAQRFDWVCAATKPKPPPPAAKPPAAAGSKTTQGDDAKAASKPAPVKPNPPPKKVAKKPTKPEKLSPPPHWDYAGSHGPEHWGDLYKPWAACKSGKAQSPVEITSRNPVLLPPIEFAYKPAMLTVIDNGHSIQVNWPRGSMIKYADKSYALVHLHFHRPSEESVNGKRYEMVAHLVHRDIEDPKRLAVIGVFFFRGKDNRFINQIWANLPKAKQRQSIVPTVELNLNELLPDDRPYYLYTGSLTTPPCTEGVTWLLLKYPVPISKEQIAVFERIYKMNARPLQALNGRVVKESQ